MTATVAHAPRLGATVLRTAARGAILVGVAVVIGIVLLQVINDSGSSPGGSGAGGGGTVTAPTTVATGGTTPTTKVGSGRPASQVRVFVQNASGVSGAAATKASALRGLGYPIVGTGNAATPQTGTTVGCKTGFSKEADTIAKLPGFAPTTTIAPFPTPAPATVGQADCVLTIGK